MNIKVGFTPFFNTNRYKGNIEDILENIVENENKVTIPNIFSLRTQIELNIEKFPNLLTSNYLIVFNEKVKYYYFITSIEQAQSNIYRVFLEFDVLQQYFNDILKSNHIAFIEEAHIDRYNQESLKIIPSISNFSVSVDYLSIPKYETGKVPIFYENRFFQSGGYYLYFNVGYQITYNMPHLKPTAINTIRYNDNDSLISGTIIFIPRKGAYSRNSSGVNYRSAEFLINQVLESTIWDDDNQPVDGALAKSYLTAIKFVPLMPFSKDDEIGGKIFFNNDGTIEFIESDTAFTPVEIESGFITQWGIFVVKKMFFNDKIWRVRGLPVVNPSQKEYLPNIQPVYYSPLINELKVAFGLTNLTIDYIELTDEFKFSYIISPNIDKLELINFRVKTAQDCSVDIDSTCLFTSTNSSDFWANNKNYLLQSSKLGFLGLKTNDVESLTGNVMLGATTGAVSGAVTGSFLPGLGTAVGATAGFVGGTITSGIDWLNSKNKAEWQLDNLANQPNRISGSTNIYTFLDYNKDWYLAEFNNRIPIDRLENACFEQHLNGMLIRKYDNLNNYFGRSDFNRIKGYIVSSELNINKLHFDKINSLLSDGIRFFDNPNIDESFKNNNSEVWFFDPRIDEFEIVKTPIPLGTTLEVLFKVQNNIELTMEVQGATGNFPIFIRNTDFENNRLYSFPINTVEFSTGKWQLELINFGEKKTVNKVIEFELI